MVWRRYADPTLLFSSVPQGRFTWCINAGYITFITRDSGRGHGVVGLRRSRMAVPTYSSLTGPESSPNKEGSWRCWAIFRLAPGDGE